MRLEIRNPKRIEEPHSLLPDFQFVFMSDSEYAFTSDWKGEYWRVTLNRWPRNRQDKWDIEVECISQNITETIKMTDTILSDITFFKAYIAKKMAEIWKSYLNSVI